ncbi:MAG: hypothetical protein SGI92_22415 [Bryobacteraceae bacterium]|nr:hypothetical protein [Bryobacteraceae bacterium]
MSTPAENPYVGLRPFDTADSHLFFGRIEQITELQDNLYAHRFNAVVGSSGCGKSSLLKAGLIPSLSAGFLLGDRDAWKIAHLAPGDSPVRNLAEAVGAAVSAPKAVIEELVLAVADGRLKSMTDFVAKWLGASENLFILVDQFEEIFPFRGRKAEVREPLPASGALREQNLRRAIADDFVDILLGLADQRKVPVYVVLTMRSDFLGDCDVFYGLPEAMNRARYLVPRLTRKQLTEAIEGPAALYGARVSHSLLDRLLNELGDRFDRLPVLQHALQRTWEEWRRKPCAGPLDTVHYERTGMLEKALGNHAGEVLKALKSTPALEAVKEPERLPTIGRVFRSLTETDLSGREVKRGIRLVDLTKETGLERDLVLAILLPFQDAGFVYRSSEAADRNPRFELSHESLIRQWDQLSTWLAEERESRDHYLELVKFSIGEQKGERGLLRDPDLAIKSRWWQRTLPQEHWAKRYSKGAPDLELSRTYLERSKNAARNRKLAVTGLVGSAILLLSALLWSVADSRDSARREAAMAKDAAADATKQKQKAEGAAGESSRLEKLANRARQAAVDAAASLDLALQQLTDSLSEIQTKNTALELKTKEAKTASELASQRTWEVRVADLVSALDSGDRSPQYKDAIWTLAGEDTRTRRAVLSRILSTEDAAYRQFATLSTGSRSVTEALFGNGSPDRLEPIYEVFEARCGPGTSDSAPVRACSAIASALSGAPSTPARQRLADRVLILLESAPPDMPAQTVSLVEGVLPLLDGNQLDRVATFLLAPSAGPQDRRTSYLEYWLRDRSDQLSEPVRRAFAARMLTLLEQSQLRIGFFAEKLLNSDERRRAAAMVSEKWTTISQDSRSTFAFLAPYLSKEIVSQMALAEVNSPRGYTTELRRLAPLLGLDTLAEITNVLVAACRRTEQQSESMGRLYSVLTAVQDRLSPPSRLRLADQLVDNLTASRDNESARRAALWLGTINGVPLVAPERFLASWTGAMARFPRENLLQLALGKAPQPEVVRRLGEHLLRSVTNNVKNYELKQPVIEFSRLLDPEGVTALMSRLILESARPENDREFRQALYDIAGTVTRSLPPPLAAAANAQILAAVNELDDLSRVYELARATSGYGSGDFRNLALASALVRKIAGKGGDYNVTLIADLVTGMTGSEDRELRRLLAANLTHSSVSLPPEQVAQTLAPLREHLSSDQAKRFAAALWNALEAPQDDYRKLRSNIALAWYRDDLSDEQCHRLNDRLLRSMKEQTTSLTADLPSAIALLSRRLTDSQAMETMVAVQEFTLSYNSSSLAPYAVAVTALAARVKPDVLQLFLERLLKAAEAEAVAASRRYDPIPHGYLLVELSAHLNAAQQIRLLPILVENLRFQGGPDRYGSVPGRPLSTFASTLAPEPLSRLTTLLLRRFEEKASPTDLEAILELPAVRGRARQFLVDVLKWPTLERMSRDTVLAALAKRSNLEGSVLRNYNVWQFADWARRQGLDMSPIPRPVGY